MNSPHDPFSASFDAIEVDPAQARAAFDHALSIAAPTAAAPEIGAPGFYLIDDAGGRFSVDRDMGVVSVKDEAVLAREHGAVHTVKLRVVHASGEAFEQELQLRVTGMVPHMVGAEDMFAIGRELAPPPAPVVAAPQRPIAIAHWTNYSAAHAALGKAEIPRVRRSFIAAELPAMERVACAASLTITEELPAVGAHAPWSL